MVRKSRPVTEWIAAARSTGARIIGEGEPYRPLVLLWMDSETETILGMEPRHPDEGLAHAADHLRSVMAEPMRGQPRMPRRIRTASGALAEALALDLPRTHPQIDIVVAATPEVDGFFDTMEEMLMERRETNTWLGAGASPDKVGGYFAAMAELHEAEPWRVVPGEAGPMQVSCKALDIENERLNIIGQGGEGHGFIRFSNTDVAAIYADVGNDPDHAELAALANRHVACSFDEREDIAPTIVEEVLAHGWQVRADDAWPSMTLFASREAHPADPDEPDLPGTDLHFRSPTDDDLIAGTAIAKAIVMLVNDEHDAVTEAYASGHGFTTECKVIASDKPFRIQLDIPASEPVTVIPDKSTAANSSNQELADDRDTGTLLAAMARLQSDAAANGELDLDAAQALTGAVLSRFEVSVDAEAFDFPLEGAGMLLEFAATQLGQTLHAFNDRDLEELLFDIIPAKVSAGPEIARELIDTARAFFRWLKHDAAFERADDLIVLLGEDAITELEARMGDESNYGPAKSMVMAAMDAGIDLSDADAVRRFMESQAGGPAFDPFAYGGMDVPATPSMTPEQTRAKNKKRKKDRKSARKARKKNR